MAFYTLMVSDCRHDGLCRKTCRWTLVWDGPVPSRSHLTAAVHAAEQRWPRVRVFQGTRVGRLISDTRTQPHHG